MRGINDGLASSKAMFAAFTSLDLIEPLKLEIKLDAETQYDLLGLHTISEQKLRNLSAERSPQAAPLGIPAGSLSRAGVAQQPAAA